MSLRKSIFLTALTSLFLVGCGGGSSTPTTKYQRVSRAFNGVESSFQKAASSNNRAPKLRSTPSASDQQEALSTIEGLFPGYETGKLSEEVSYDSPPMAQFRYMKAVFDKVGDSFAFDTKYDYDLTGNVYIDMETGKKATQEDQYKYAYVFNFSLQISIDANELIQADVGFDITLTQGSDVRHTQWYVAMDLDYDIDNGDSANYELTMYTDNKEGDLPYLHSIQGYEYDYVKVKENNIEEWRKFHYSASKELLRDASHQSLESYVQEGVILEPDNPKWYKNGVLRKRVNLTEEQQKTLLSAYYGGLGLNSTDLDPNAFLKKSSTKLDKIQEVYREICNLYGDDIIYNLVCKNGSGGGEQSATWPYQAIRNYIGFDLPVFNSSSTITYATTENYDQYGSIYIEVRGAQSTDFDNYGGTLENNGFTFTGTLGDIYAYACPTNGSVVVVALNPINPSIYISVQDSGGTDIKGGYPFAYPYDSVGTQENYSAYDVGYLIAKMSEGRFSEKTIAQYVIPDECISYIFQFDSLKDDAGEYLRMIRDEYASLYIDGGWNEIVAGGAYYETTSADDRLIAFDFSSGSKTFLIHSFSFIPGSMKTILEGGGGSSSSSSSSSSSESSSSSSSSSSSEPSVAEVNVYLCYVANSEVIRTETRRYKEGELIEPDSFEYPAYWDLDCLSPIKETIVAWEGLVIYLLTEKKETLGTFYLYDIVDGSPVLTEKFESAYNSGIYGCGLEYQAYYDEACTDLIDPEEEILVPEEGIKVYRKDKTNVDYVSVQFDRYVNGILVPTDYPTICTYRKGKYILGNDLIRYADAYDYDVNFETYLSEDSDAAVVFNKYYAITENTVAHVKCESSNYHAVDVYHGDTKIGTSICPNDGSVYDVPLSVELANRHLYEVDYENSTSKKVILNYTEQALCLTTVYMFNGHSVYQCKDWFSSAWGGYSIWGGGYYTDPECTQPLELDEQGSAIITSTTTLYRIFEGSM